MNIANITKRFALYSGIDGAETYKWKSIIDDAVVYVNSIVTKGNLSEDDELRLENCVPFTLLSCIPFAMMTAFLLFPQVI